MDENDVKHCLIDGVPREVLIKNSCVNCEDFGEGCKGCENDDDGQVLVILDYQFSGVDAYQGYHI